MPDGTNNIESIQHLAEIELEQLLKPPTARPPDPESHFSIVIETALFGAPKAPIIRHVLNEGEKNAINLLLDYLSCQIFQISKRLGVIDQAQFAASEDMAPRSRSSTDNISKIKDLLAKLTDKIKTLLSHIPAANFGAFKEKIERINHYIAAAHSNEVAALTQNTRTQGRLPAAGTAPVVFQHFEEPELAPSKELQPQMAQAMEQTALTDAQEALMNAAEAYFTESTDEALKAQYLKRINDYTILITPHRAQTTVSQENYLAIAQHFFSTRTAENATPMTDAEPNQEAVITFRALGKKTTTKAAIESARQTLMAQWRALTNLPNKKSLANSLLQPPTLWEKLTRLRWPWKEPIQEAFTFSLDELIDLIISADPEIGLQALRTNQTRFSAEPKYLVLLKQRLGLAASIARSENRQTPVNTIILEELVHNKKLCAPLKEYQERKQALQPNLIDEPIWDNFQELYQPQGQQQDDMALQLYWSCLTDEEKVKFLKLFVVTRAAQDKKPLLTLRAHDLLVDTFLDCISTPKKNPNYLLDALMKSGDTPVTQYIADTVLAHPTLLKDYRHVSAIIAYASPAMQWKLLRNRKPAYNAQDREALAQQLAEGIEQTECLKVVIQNLRIQHPDHWEERWQALQAHIETHVLYEPQCASWHTASQGPEISLFVDNLRLKTKSAATLLLDLTCTQLTTRFLNALDNNELMVYLNTALEDAYPKLYNATGDPELTAAAQMQFEDNINKLLAHCRAQERLPEHIKDSESADLLHQFITLCVRGANNTTADLQSFLLTLKQHAKKSKAKTKILANFLVRRTLLLSDQPIPFTFQDFIELLKQAPDTEAVWSMATILNTPRRVWFWDVTVEKMYQDCQATFNEIKTPETSTALADQLLAEKLPQPPFDFLFALLVDASPKARTDAITYYHSNYVVPEAFILAQLQKTAHYTSEQNSLCAAEWILSAPAGSFSLELIIEAMKKIIYRDPDNSDDPDIVCKNSLVTQAFATYRDLWAQAPEKLMDCILALESSSTLQKAVLAIVHADKTLIYDNLCTILQKFIARQVPKFTTDSDFHYDLLDPLEVHAAVQLENLLRQNAPIVSISEGIKKWKTTLKKRLFTEKGIASVFPETDKILQAVFEDHQGPAAASTNLVFDEIPQIGAAMGVPWGDESPRPVATLQTPPGDFTQDAQHTGPVPWENEASEPLNTTLQTLSKDLEQFVLGLMARPRTRESDSPYHTKIEIEIDKHEKETAWKQIYRLFKTHPQCLFSFYDALKELPQNNQKGEQAKEVLLTLIAEDPRTPAILEAARINMNFLAYRNTFYELNLLYLEAQLNLTNETAAKRECIQKLIALFISIVDNDMLPIDLQKAAAKLLNPEWQSFQALPMQYKLAFVLYYPDLPASVMPPPAEDTEPDAQTVDGPDATEQTLLNWIQCHGIELINKHPGAVLDLLANSALSAGKRTFLFSQLQQLTDAQSGLTLYALLVQKIVSSATALEPLIAKMTQATLLSSPEVIKTATLVATLLKGATFLLQAKQALKTTDPTDKRVADVLAAARSKHAFWNTMLSSGATVQENMKTFEAASCKVSV